MRQIGRSTDKARMPAVGRFLPFMGTLRRQITMLQCMTRETAISGN